MKAAARARRLTGLVLAVALCPGYAQPASNDREQPAEIFADRVNINQRTGVSRYLGNVTFTQGTVRIAGDVVELSTREGELTLLEVTGAPATYAETDDNGDQLRARAERISYDADAGKLLLRGDARLCRSGEYFRSERIDYDTESRGVEAGNPAADSGERVHITLRPGQASGSGNCPELP